MALISAIVPVYNAKDYIEKCADSIYQQTYSDIELILVDDGSSDGSSSICDNIANKWSSSAGTNNISNNRYVQVIHTDNRGVSAARNTGVEMAKGEYITFIDADDTIDNTFIEELYNVIEDSDESISDVVMVDKTNKIKSSGGKISGYYYLENSILEGNTHVWNKLYKLDFIREEKIEFDSGFTIGEDMLYLLKIALHIAKKHQIYILEEKGYNYLDNENGAMNASFKESYLDQIKCWEMAEDYLEDLKKELSPYIYVKLATIQIMATFLVVGKLAVADNVPKELYDRTITHAKKSIKHAKKRNGAVAALSNGYKIKNMIFGISDKLYMKMYGAWKN